ncbi:S-adenosylmethionine:tRNA ribosyltransferase-isomerase [Cupriavidus basilensis]
MMLTLSDFDFELPPELIAQTALPERGASRLLVVDTDARDGTTRLADRTFADIVGYLRPNDLLVFNDTRHQGTLLRPQGQRRKGRGAGRAGAGQPYRAGPGARLRRRPRAANCAWRMPRRHRGPARGPVLHVTFPEASALDLIETPRPPCRCRRISPT